MKRFHKYHIPRRHYQRGFNKQIEALKNRKYNNISDYNQLSCTVQNTQAPDTTFKATKSRVRDKIFLESWIKGPQWRVKTKIANKFPSEPQVCCHLVHI